MKQVFIILLFVLFVNSYTYSQKGYTTSSGELIFSFVDPELNGVSLSSGMRFSFFFHYGHYWHVDLNNNFGVFSGAFIRNIGFRLTENDQLDMHRAYSVGVPLAVKLGSFSKHTYLYAGGDYELLFHYKHKRKVDGDKFKKNDWFSDQVNKFMPCLFAGVQLPKGLNLRFSYFMKDFLNQDFRGTEFGESVDYTNLKTQVYFVSLSFNFRTDKYKDVFKKDDDDAFVSL